MPFFGDLFASEILKKPVLDPKGEELGRVKDLTVVKGEPLPKVSSLILESRRRHFKLPWTDLNIFNRRIISANIYKENLKPYEFTDDELLMARDIFDRQIVDVNGAKVVRVNDIKIEGFNLEALLVAVDVGMRGILRRLGFEKKGENLLRFFGIHLSYSLISWNYLQPLESRLSSISLTVPRQTVSELHPADLAEIINQVSHNEGTALIKDLDAETAAETLSELGSDTQAAIIASIDTARAADIIEEMPPDAAADILGELPAEKAQEILGILGKEDAQDIQELLGHEEDTAGGMMTNVFITYKPDITVKEAMERFKLDADEIETIYYIYVTDAEERLKGALSLKELLLSSPEAKLSDVMVTKLKTVSPDADEKKVARLVSKYNLVALPVVDNDGFILGVVTIDDIMERILPSRTKRKRSKV